MHPAVNQMPRANFHRARVLQVANSIVTGTPGTKPAAVRWAEKVGNNPVHIIQSIYIPVDTGDGIK